MRIERRYTNEGKSPYDAIAFKKVASEIRNPDGSVVFRLDDVLVPADWSQVACDVLAQKYFRKAGVPARSKHVAEKGIPTWLSRREPDLTAMADMDSARRFTGESDARQVFDRLAGTRTWGGLVGIGGYPNLIDGGNVTAPRWAIYGTKGEWEVEDIGIPPDVTVEQDPAKMRQGHDPQLEAAVAVALDALAKSPPPTFRQPPAPDRHPVLPDSAE